MFDPFALGHPSIPSSSGSRDYRNGKYQGGFSSGSGLREGIGLLLDHNYLLALARWRCSQVEGPLFLLFPDRSLFTGDLSESLPKGLCTFRTSSGSHIYCRFEQKGVSTFLFEDPLRQTLQAVKVGSSTLSTLISDRQTHEDYLAGQFQAGGDRQSLALGENLSYSDEAQKVKILRDSLGGQAGGSLLSYRQFVREQFGREKGTEALEVVETKSEFGFKFKQSSIRCRLGSQEGPLVLKCLGYYNAVSSSMEVARREQGGAWVEETVGERALAFPASQRPPECLVALHAYYKQSLEFVNEYLAVDYLYRLRFILHALEQLHLAINANSQGQRLL
jgi:hypothetical protein